MPLDYPGQVAADYPDLLEILEEKVKPERLKNNRENYRKYWWQYAERRPGLVRALKNCHRFLSNALYSTHLSFVFLPPTVDLANKLSAFPLRTGLRFLCFSVERMRGGRGCSARR